MSSVADGIVQASAVVAYRRAARDLERQAWVLHRIGQTREADEKARLARHVGLSAVRENAGAEPDEWERRP